MRVLLVDNHDSYTFNLYQLLAQVTGAAPLVLRNDDPALTTGTDVDRVVISPGPGRPQRARDIGRTPELLAGLRIPVLGVCLGHQLLGHLAGATVMAAPRPRHGHLTTVRHTGDELFAGLPTEFTAVRYHSLCVAEPLPDVLVPTAWAEDGVLMALRHRELPRYGVQFHPESVASDHGATLVRNFCGSTERIEITTVRRPAPPATLDLISTVLPEVDAEAVFLARFAASPDVFWLDSGGGGRFSFLGDASGPLSEVLTYTLGNGVRIRDHTGEHVVPASIFDVLNERLGDRVIADDTLPFDLTGGYVGYFGYELKSECTGTAAHTASTPDSAWLFADRLVVIDHHDHSTYVIAVHDNTTRESATRWMFDTATALLCIPTPPESRDGPPIGVELPDQARYEADIEDCQRQLRLGESYEICLTTRLHLPAPDDDVEFYRRLRRANPAPFAAFLRIGGTAVFSSSPERFLRVERDGHVHSKPIKGTARRDKDDTVDSRLAGELKESPKVRAEHLMIVDLLRNDLGQVCQIGSVGVRDYFAVETYRTVHQLVSTVYGELEPALSPVDCVKACFPGGSMTGAPKQRTMEIIDRLETEARGVYSGALGYFGLSGGADLSIVIRTAVRHGGELSIGAGGAIVLDSDPADEYREMLLKANAVLLACRSAPAGQHDYDAETVAVSSTAGVRSGKWHAAT